MTGRQGILRLPIPTLLEALGLPPDTEVQDVRMRFDMAGEMELRIEHPALPVTGPCLPPVGVLMESVALPCGCVQRPRFSRWLP